MTEQLSLYLNINGLNTQIKTPKNLNKNQKKKENHDLTILPLKETHFKKNDAS